MLKAPFVFVVITYMVVYFELQILVLWRTLLRFKINWSFKGTSRALGRRLQRFNVLTTLLNIENILLSDRINLEITVEEF